MVSVTTMIPAGPCTQAVQEDELDIFQEMTPGGVQLQETPPDVPTPWYPLESTSYV